MCCRIHKLFANMMLGCLLTAVAWAGPAEEARLELVGQQIAIRPFDARLFLQRALIYSDMGLVDQALADVARAETLGDPQDAALVHGIVQYRQGQLAAAEALLEQFLAKHPRHVGALEYCARILRDAGKTGPAAAAYLALLEQRPDSTPGTYLAASNLLAAEQGYAAAIALLDRRMAQVGPIPQLQRAAIAMEVQRQDYPAAILRLGSLHDLIRSTPQWHLEMAALLLLNGDREQAGPHLQIAREQLDTLRPVPARLQAEQELNRLQAAYEMG